MGTTHTTIQTPLAELTLVAEDGALCGVYYPGHWTRPDRAAFGERSAHGFEVAEQQLRAYLAGSRAAFDLPTRAAGSAFQRSVWELVSRIPYGRTTTYGDIARTLGDASLAREVGAAVGRNPLSVIVPCHRVVGKGAKLTGYAGGLDRKRFLLALEGIAVAPEAAAKPELALF
jgi:methylated-DNA-[protein]-cysteine S-methyltransferase